MNKYLKYICTLMLFGCCAIHHASAQQLAIKTNALYLAAGSPNFGMELVTGNRTSLDLSLVGAYKPYTTDVKFIGFQPEFRYWIAGRPLVREYIGLTATGVAYDIKGKQKTFVGDAVGVGLSMGYVLPLSNRCNVEFFAGFGGYYFWQIQHFKKDNPDDNLAGKEINATGWKLLPTKIGVSFTYILK